MKKFCSNLMIAVSLTGFCQLSLAMDDARVETGADAAIAQYNLSGDGVTIVILDRGIDYTHPDFIKPDGTTRIKGILDMSNQFNWCNGVVPTPVEYTEAQINAALDQSGPALATRDAVGHGTVTAGIAAGNGSAFAGGKYRGIAPEADLLIVKFTSEGAPSRGGEPAETPFVACFDDALDWVDQKINEIGQPAVALANWGTQFGPMDGTSALSRKIDEVFPPDGEGRIWVEGSGDEGNLDNHAGGRYQDTIDTVIPFSISASGTYRMTLWYDGDLPADITVALDGGATAGPLGPGQSYNQNGIFAAHYTPGNDFYPWLSDSGDRAFLVDITNHIGTGEIRIRAQSQGSGRVDAYGSFTSNLVFTGLLVPGRLVDIATTQSAIVLGAYVNKNNYVDIDGILRDVTNEGSSDEIWDGSSGGPTRDGRTPGVDIMTPGHNVIAAYGSVNTNFGAARFNLVQDGGGFYGRQGAVSGAAPILLGAVALLLEMDPTLTTDRLRTILHDTAVTDGFTGTVPNTQWGYGKLDILAAAQEVESQLNVIDTDGDGIPDDIDPDDDNDGILDGDDSYPLLPFPPPELVLRRTTDNRWFSYATSFADNTNVVIEARGFAAMTRNASYETVSRSDFNGDGVGDVLVRDVVGTENGRWVMYNLDGPTVLSGGFVNLTRNADWQPVASDDFDGDGKADLLLRNVDGRWLLYLLDSQTVKSQGILAMSTDLNDTFIGTGDFDADGRHDVLLRRADGSWLMYQVDGLSAPVESTPAMTSNLAFAVQSLADFNGDGTADVLLRRNDGRWFMYELNGQTIDNSGSPAMSENTAFGLVSDSDFDGDGNADALLRRDDGRWFLYTLDGVTVLEEGNVNMTGNPLFELVTSDDFNGDGKADALLRRSDGRWVLYGLDGAVPTILGQGVPDMTRNEAWVPQLN